MYYIFLENDKLGGCGECECLNEEVQNIQVTEEVYNNYINDTDLYIWNGTEIVLNPNYEEEKKAARHNYAMELSMTPLDFLKAIEPYGITYDIIKQLMANNPQVERELRFCQNVYRKHPMIIQFAEQFGITSEQLDELFIAANGEPD